MYSYGHCCNVDENDAPYYDDHCDNVFDRGDCVFTDEVRVRNNPKKLQELYQKAFMKI